MTQDKPITFQLAIFRDLSSFRSLALQTILALLSLLLFIHTLPFTLKNIVLFWTQPSLIIWLSDLFQFIIVLGLIYDHLVLSLSPTFIRFSLAAHTFRNLKSGYVNTNQYLNFQIVRVMFRIVFQPFLIFIVMTMLSTEKDMITGRIILGDSLGHILMRLFGFFSALLSAVQSYQQFYKAKWFLEYELDETSGYIFTTYKNRDNDTVPLDWSCRTERTQQVLIYAIVASVSTIMWFWSLYSQVGISASLLVSIIGSILSLIGNLESTLWSQTLTNNLRLLVINFGNTLSAMALFQSMHTLFH